MHSWVSVKVISLAHRQQVDIFSIISKNHGLQILHLKHHAYYYYLTLTQQLKHTL